MRKKYDIIEDIIIYHYSLYSIPNYLEQFSILGLTVCEKCVQKSSFAKVYKEAWSKQFFFANYWSSKQFSHVSTLSAFSVKKKLRTGVVYTITMQHILYIVHICTVSSYMFKRVLMSALKKLFPFYDHKF